MVDRVLIVSEDMEVIADAQRSFHGSETSVLGCAGPVHGPCELACKGGCTLASRSQVTLVVAPPGGSFVRHSAAMSAGEYAELLQARHPETHVILCGGQEGYIGPTGDVTTVPTYTEVLDAIGGTSPSGDTAD